MRRMSRAREGHDALVITVPSGSDTTPDRTILYASGGRSTSAAATDHDRTTEYAVIDTATGDLGPFTVDPALLVQPRAFFPLLTNVGQRDALRPPPPEEPPCVDLDGDGVLSPACGGCDCDDTDPTIYCGAPDACGDGIDSDCDMIDPSCLCPIDADMDGVDVPMCGGCDCDDTNPAIHCGAPDPCGDGVDSDCDGVDLRCMCPIDADMDGADVPGCMGCDCNDADPTIRCGIPEDCTATPTLCDDGIDQNCDGADCECIIIFSGRGPSGLPWSASASWSDGLFGRPYTRPALPGGFARSLSMGPILFVAVAGDDRYVESGGAGNTGTTTFEVTAISTAPDATNGSLLGWTQQSNELPSGRHTYGLDALLYYVRLPERRRAALR
jgi:hypothetical protein